MYISGVLNVSVFCCIMRFIPCKVLYWQEMSKFIDISRFVEILGSKETILFGTILPSYFRKSWFFHVMRDYLMARSSLSFLFVFSLYFNHKLPYLINFTNFYNNYFKSYTSNNLWLIDRIKLFYTYINIKCH